jgi:hypothetical protein
MNSGSFLKYIKTPSLLHQLSYEELKTMVLQYPYSANLHFVLLLKSKLENHKDYDKNLAMAAAYSIDRRYLFLLLQHPDLQSLPASQVLKEDVLELKDLSSLEQDLAKEPVLLTNEVIPGEAPPLEMEILEQPSEAKEDIDHEEDFEEIPHEQPAIPKTQESHQHSDELLSTMNALNAIIKDVIDHEEKSEAISTVEIQEINDLTETLKTLLPEEQTAEKQESSDNIDIIPATEKAPEIPDHPEKAPEAEDQKEDKPAKKRKKKENH